VIDGHYYDPPSKLEELEEWGEEDETTNTHADTDGVDASDADGVGWGSGVIASSREQEEEQEQEHEQEDAYVSAASSPQVSAPSSPRAQGVMGGAGVDAGDLSRLSGGVQDKKTSGGSGNASPENSGRSPRKGKKLQSVKTTLFFVDVSPEMSPSSSPSGLPVHGDGDGKHLVGQPNAGRGAVARRDEPSEDEGDVSEDSDASSSTSRSTSRSASITSTTASDRTTKPSSPRATPHSASMPHSSSEPPAANRVQAVEEAGEDEEGELPQMYPQGEHGGPEYWGREYSSLTHRSILEGFRALEEGGVQDVVKGEALALVLADFCQLLLEQTHAHLPVLLQELRRHYRVDETAASALTQEQIDELNERGMSIGRPLEAVLTILRQLKREVLDLSRSVHASHKERLRSGALPWVFFEEFPMVTSVEGSEAPYREPLSLSEDGTANAGDGDGEGERVGSGALTRKEFEWDESLSVSILLRAFLTEYHSSYVTERSLVAQSQLLPRSGKRPEVMMNRQFVRDVPSLLRLNGAPPPGESPEDKVRYVYDAIVKAVEGNTEKAQRVTIVCNQNLGVYLYEKLVQVYSDQTDFLVMQTGEHSLDLRTMRRGVVAVFESVFRLSPVESVTENEGSLLKAMVKVDFVHKNVSYKFSKPMER
jgi:hypothetical protein